MKTALKYLLALSLVFGSAPAALAETYYVPICKQWGNLRDYNPLASVGVYRCLDGSAVLGNLDSYLAALADPIYVPFSYSGSDSSLDWLSGQQPSIKSFFDTQGYTGHTLTDAEYAQFQALLVANETIPFDVEYAGQIYLAGMGFVLALYVLSYTVGSGIRMLDRH